MQTNQFASEVKRSLRRQLLSERSKVGSDVVAANSRKICEQILSWPVFLQAKTIMGYLAMPSEPQLDELLVAAVSAGKTVCVPLMGSQYGWMEAAAITGVDQLITGRMGVRMPDPSKTKILNPDLIDLVFTPGLAFAQDGSRLGFGAGYYDRFLIRSPQAIRVGIAWSLQVVDSVPTDEHDVFMQWVITEEGIFGCPGAS